MYDLATESRIPMRQGVFWRATSPEDAYREAVRRIFDVVGPSLAALVEMTPVYFTYEVDTAAVDDSGRVFINPDWFASLPPNVAAAVLLHEALHANMQHPLRGRYFVEQVVREYGLDPAWVHELHNVVADAFINELIARSAGNIKLKIPEGSVTWSINGSNFRLQSLLDDLGINITFDDLLKGGANIEGVCMAIITALMKKRGARPPPGAIVEPYPTPSSGKEGKGGGGETRVGQGPESRRQPRGGEREGKGGEGRVGGIQLPKPGFGGKEGDYLDKTPENARPANLAAEKEPLRREGKGGSGEREGRSREEGGEGERLGREGEEGSEGTERGGISPEELAERIREAEDRINSALTTGGIGRSPAGILRPVLIDLENASAAINWRDVLFEAVNSALYGLEEPAWSRVSKKFPYEKPGHIYLGYPSVVVLVDTSGSITEEGLRRFLNEILEIATLVEEGGGRVVVIPWDATAYEPVEMHGASDIEEVVKHLKGGGGTVIAPALEKALELTNPQDIVVILSDFYIDDEDKPETVRLFNELAAKARKVILVTIGDNPSPQWLLNNLNVEVYRLNVPP